MPTDEIFSFHLLNLPLREAARLILSPPKAKGLLHAEAFFTMKLGEPVASARRYGIRSPALLGWWTNESALDEFRTANPSLADGWHIRMKLYRRWGSVTEIEDAIVDPAIARPGEPVVGLTLARLKLSEARRFTKWGKPVEEQVRDQRGKLVALAGFRPLNTFCTFSIWKDEAAMIDMVGGRIKTENQSHVLAMQERSRRDFHHEFTTMRLVASSKSDGFADGRLDRFLRGIE